MSDISQHNDRVAETRGLVRDLTAALANRNRDVERLRAALWEMLHHFGNPKREEWLSDSAFVMAKNAVRMAKEALEK